MAGSVSVDEILSPEELAACRAYFIATSDNAPSALTKPACFHIWLRVVLLTIRRAKCPTDTDSEPTTQSLPPSAESFTFVTSTATRSTTPKSPRSSVPAPPTAVSPSDAPPQQTSPSANLTSASSSAPSKSAPSNDPHIPEIAPKPVLTITTAAPAPTLNSASAPTCSPKDATPALDKPIAVTPSKAINGTSGTKAAINTQGIEAPNLPNAKRAVSPVVPRKTSATAFFQTAKRSSPMPKSTTSSSPIGNPSASKQGGSTTSFAASNATLQSTIKSSTARATPRPNPSLSPAVPATKTTSTVAPTTGHSPTQPTILCSVASTTTDQTQTTKSDSSATPSRADQSSSVLPTVSTATSKPATSLPTTSPGSLSVSPPAAKFHSEAERVLEARGDPKITVCKTLYEGLLSFYIKHQDRLKNSGSIPSQPASQPPKTVQKEEAKASSTVNQASKRKQDDTNDKVQRVDRRGYEEDKGRSTGPHDKNGRNRGSDHEGSREYRSRRIPTQPRNKRRRSRYDQYGDYYDGSTSDDLYIG